jgi:hypothetical protein
MVNISALITDGQQILLFQNDKNEKNEYALPSVCASTLVGAKRKLKKLINNLGIQFFFNREIYSAFNNGDDNCAFLCYVTSYTSLSKNEDYIWIEINKFKDVALKDMEAHSSQAVFKYIRERLDVIDAVKAKIRFLNQQSGLTLSFSEKLNGVQIFIYAPRLICPFSYHFSFDFVNEEEVEFNVDWILNRSVAPGDKSDIYIFFSETMGMLLKLFLQEPVVVTMFGNCFVKGEIGGASLSFESNKYSEIINKHEIVERIALLFEVFKIAMSLHGELIGSISHKNIVKNNDEILKCFGKENFNFVFREEHACYYNDHLECIYIDNGLYDSDKLFSGYSNEVISGTHGKILVQKIKDFTFLNYIDADDWKTVQEIIKRRKIIDYKLLAQSNKLYVIANKEIWVIDGWFHHTIAELEKEDILDRNKREQALLLANREFSWKYPLNYGRFEELCADLLEQIKPNARIRLAGDANNADGGRDILVYNPDDTLHICQCKAYQKNVGKSDVQDIRDTIEFHGATGFYLMVSSRITSPLIKNLEILKQKYAVDWWTEREIFNYLRRYPFIADRYRDILEIK